MQPFFAGAVPTSFPDQLALAVTAFILVFPAACLLSALLQPAPLSAHAIALLQSARRWCHYALGFAVFGIAMIELSMYQQGYAIYDDLRSHLFWTHPHLGTGTVAMLLIAGSHLLCRRSVKSPSSPALDRPPSWAIRYRSWAPLVMITVVAPLLLHRHPLSHIPIAIWATIVVLVASIFAASDYLATLPGPTDLANPPTHPSTLRNRLLLTFRVAALGALTLALTIATTLGLARLQEHLARLHGDHLAAQLEEITHHGSRPYPAALPNLPAFTSPWYLTVPVTYLPGTSPRDYRLSHPLILHPGAQNRRDPQSPAWYWWGWSDR